MSIAQKEQQMNLGQILAMELTHEAATTRKCLERLPADKFDWKPHEKSMTLGRLAGHLVEMLLWVKETVEKDELDFAKVDYTPREYKEASELVGDLDEKLTEMSEILNNAANEAMSEKWTLKNGEEVYFEMPKAAVLRGMVMNHIVHHRGQLSVYMRMLDIPVPGLYGPSADEPTM